MNPAKDVSLMVAFWRGCEIIPESLTSGNKHSQEKKLMRRFLASIAVLGFFFCSDRGVHASDWPRFRGPNGTGISSDKEIPVQWTESNVLWKTVIPGLGNSSPVVWGNHVFLQSADANGKERYLICLSAGDGKILWTRSVPSSKAHIHPRNTWASATPATDGHNLACTPM